MGKVYYYPEDYDSYIERIEKEEINWERVDDDYDIDPKKLKLETLRREDMKIENDDLIEKQNYQEWEANCKTKDELIDCYCKACYKYYDYLGCDECIEKEMECPHYDDEDDEDDDYYYDEDDEDIYDEEDDDNFHDD